MGSEAMILPATWVEWLVGGVLIALCAVWLKRHTRSVAVFWVTVSVWLAVWAGSAVLSGVAWVEAGRALESAPPDQRLEIFAHWLHLFDMSRMANRLVVGVGCLVAFGVWMKRQARGAAKA